MIELNHEQSTAAAAREGAYAVLAGPGSGKTRVIIARYVQLVNEGHSPSNIITATFTHEAARTMRTRAEKYFANLSKNDRAAGFMTFHALALTFAMRERESFLYKLVDFPLATEAGGYAIQAVRKYGIRQYEEFREWVSQQKRLGRYPRDTQKLPAPSATYPAAYQFYESLCMEHGVLDFDSLLMEMVRILRASALLRSEDSVFARWQYDWIQVDESQDADHLQWEIVKLLSHRRGNVFAVGDGNQSIYSFRAASPEMFLKFDEMFPGAKFLYLGQNYRSTGKIVEFVKEIAPIKNELLERFCTDKGPGDDIVVQPYPSDYDEAAGVVDQIVKLKPITGNVAILARTNRALRWFQDQLQTRKIRYNLLGKSGFWQQNEITNLVKEVREHHRPSENILIALSAAMRDTRVEERYQHYAGIDNSPLENLRELVQIAKRFTKVEEFLAYASKLQRASHVKSGVALGTVHQAKGLEWEYVFVAGAVEGVMPHKNGDPDEEQRIFFVACSRAARVLVISYAGAPSHFIDKLAKKPNEPIANSVGQKSLPF